MTGSMEQFHRTMAAWSAAPEMLRRLELIAKLAAPGNRTLDEMMRDMGFVCDFARAAIARAHPPSNR